MARRKREFNTFNLSFLDIMSCGFGAVVLVFLIMNHAIENEQLELNDPEIERTYQLWYETWTEGRAAVIKDVVDDYLPYRCRAEKDFYTGEDHPEDSQEDHGTPMDPAR